MVVLGITSLPGVSNALSWAEFSIVQRYLGWTCLTFAILHIIFMELGDLVANKFQCVIIADQAQVNDDLYNYSGSGN